MPVAVLGAALGGCFADAPADDSAVLPGEPTSPGRGDGTLVDVLGGDPPPAVVHGTYRVPVTDDDLAPFATYEIEDASVEIVDGILNVSFLLPEGLIGVAVHATFTGEITADDEIAVSGPVGTGTCEFDGNVKCEFNYDGAYIQTDVDAVGAYWRARGDTFVDARVHIATLFDEDPLGVLRLSVE